MVLKRAETIKEDSIKVVCRIRPLNSKEKDMESEVAVDFPADEDVHQITHKPTVSGLGRFLWFFIFKNTKAFFTRPSNKYSLLLIRAKNTTLTKC